MVLCNKAMHSKQAPPPVDLFGECKISREAGGKSFRLVHLIKAKSELRRSQWQSKEVAGIDFIDGNTK